MPNTETSTTEPALPKGECGDAKEMYLRYLCFQAKKIAEGDSSLANWSEQGL